MRSLNIQLRSGQKGALIGRNGTGKTYFAKHQLLPFQGPLIITDPKGTFEFYDCEIYDSVDEIERRRPKRVIYRPRRHDLRTADGRDAIFNYAYELVQGGRPTFMYNDELIPFVRGVDPTPSLLECVALGREFGLTMLNGTQRPKRVPVSLWSEAQLWYAFQLSWPADIKTVAEFVAGYTGKPPDPAWVERHYRTYGYRPNPLHAFTYFNAETQTPPRMMILGPLK